MGRMRTMKPEFFRSRSMAKLPREVRMTFVGLWTEADDHGNGIADERLLKGAIWPLDDDLEPLHVLAHIRMLHATGHIQLYTAADETYFHIINFTKHQAAAYRRGEPKFPPPSAGQPLDPDPAHKSVQENASRTQTSAVTGNEEQGTGNRESSPAFESHALARTSARDRAAALNQSAHSVPSHRVIEAFADTCQRRPPTKVLSQLAVEVDALLLDGWLPDELATVLARWRDKGMHPKTLASVANELANAAPTRASPAARPSTTDARVAAVLALARPEPEQHLELPGAAS